jgi:hypothetical protein
MITHTNEISYVWMIDENKKEEKKTTTKSYCPHFFLPRFD